MRHLHMDCVRFLELNNDWMNTYKVREIIKSVFCLKIVVDFYCEEY
ncbi:hypothetical protein CNEO4_620061 [Clostridium neonatale]|nr:hypothetical protein CNEO4_620061 [Clostridium neonatale]